MMRRWCIYTLVLFVLISTAGCAVHDEGKGLEANSAPAHLQYADVSFDVGHINNCVYEVIVPKPLNDPITYEKPLPMDLLPFQVRNDKYYSIGTAFASSSTEFTTAAHVMNLMSRSLFKEPLIRDVKGNVFNIDKIVKFSNRRDFVVFTVKGRQSPEYLETNQTPKINERVFAVGNALGQGVAIRDGLYTSNTPEEIDGKWNWLRFSAAASPGNSGGPLLDKNGKVVGLVLLKSPNENLNYALPISEVNRDYENNAEIFYKGIFGLEIFDFVKSGVLDTKIELPLPYNDLRQACTTAAYDYRSKMIKDLMAENKANIFPNGSGSDKILYTSSANSFPQLISRRENGNWEVNHPKDIKNVDLDNNGKIGYGLIKGTIYARLDRPDNIFLKDICSDSKIFMDLMLKALNSTRTVGPEKIRITSFGKADSEHVHTDTYGRKWLVKTWPLEYIDRQMAVFILPLPDGCAVMMKVGKSGFVDDYIEEMKIFTDFINVSYSGTFKQWREYLEMKTIIPSAFSNIEIKPDNEFFSYKSKDFQAKCDCSTMKIADNSILTIWFSYRR
ncbi:MAG: trypsin-like peptidase domain-containing protein, partial [Syntrophobacteraceae bacterium]